MKQAAFQTFVESIGKPPQEVFAILLGLTQPAVNYYVTGKRPVPPYVAKEVEFFQGMPKRKQDAALQEAVRMYEQKRKGGHS